MGGFWRFLGGLSRSWVKATSGEEALRHLLSMEFAVIILDVMMPGMDGFETARMIRQRPQSRHIPIIFVTAYAQTELDRTRGYELGAADYLFTPIIPDVFKTKVMVFIDLFRTNKTVQQQALNLAEVNQKLYEAHQEMADICKELNAVTSRLQTHIESQSRQFLDAEKKYRSIFENVSEGIFQITPDGDILLANPAMISMLGYDSYEQFTAAIGNIYQQLFVNPDKGEEFRQKMVNNGAVHGFEAAIYAKDKAIIWVFIIANTTHGRDQQIHYEGIILNITQRKKLEEKLIKSERVEAIAELAAETAHEIRNPLQVISAGIYLLKMITDKDDEKISKTIEQINNAVFRATKFIDELMDIARTPALNIGSVDVNKLLQDVAKELCISSNIRVDWNIADSLPNIPADPEKLREVITNLLKNAMEAMEQDGVLGIKTEIEKKFVKITMDDTGNGMAEDEMVKMWTPFYTSKRMGKGLGMAVVKRLIEAHKGKIDVESEIGVGTRVGVRLPIG
ncbi:MAG: ATP-binding protein [Candidatus Desantisbacteria bacterium]